MSSHDFLDKLKDEDIQIGDDHEVISQDQVVDDAVIVGDQKIDNVIAFGKSGSVICKGIHKDSR